MFGIESTPESRAGRIAQSACEGVTLAGIGIITFAAGRLLYDSFGLEDWNVANADGAALNKLLKDDPVYFMYQASFAGPVIEEALFRGIPLGLVALAGIGNKGSWITGTASAALFAYLHNMHQMPDGTIAFANGFPISPFISGLLYWEIAKRKGVEHSIIAHGTRNAIVTGLTLAGA